MTLVLMPRLFATAEIESYIFAISPVLGVIVVVLCLLFFINAIVSSVIILYISNLICNIKLNKFKLYNYFKDLLIYIGSNSICYLIFNQLVIMVVLKVFEFLHIPTNYYVKVLVIPIVLFLLYIINKILNTKRLKVLIGK